MQLCMLFVELPPRGLCLWECRLRLPFIAGMVLLLWVIHPLLEWSSSPCFSGGFSGFVLTLHLWSWFVCWSRVLLALISSEACNCNVVCLPELRDMLSGSAVFRWCELYVGMLVSHCLVSSSPVPTGVSYMLSLLDISI
jgi:hypothetical protein